jgi:hypothetical protein
MKHEIGNFKRTFPTAISTRDENMGVVDLTNKAAKSDTINWEQLPCLLIMPFDGAAKVPVLFFSFELDGQKIKYFTAPVTLHYLEPLTDRFGNKSVKVTFEAQLRNHFEVLKNRIAITLGLDNSESIKNPIAEDNTMYLKLGPKFELPCVKEFGAKIQFGFYMNDSKMGFFMKLV